ncbi:MAG: hypothetical protein HKP61_15575 [Dactylosporangium sp.]|nr:hypothetical protein [Dactylosporangium sp.]NNJ62326.1 hypothetical protein [Dactylosporangium sp.]
MSGAAIPRAARRGNRDPQPLRLAPGQLRARVLAHLHRHPDLDFSPTDLARAVGRPGSRGAVINACRQLTGRGQAVRSQDRPQRYRSTPPDQPTSTAPPPPPPLPTPTPTRRMEPPHHG